MMLRPMVAAMGAIALSAGGAGASVAAVTRRAPKSVALSAWKIPVQIVDVVPPPLLLLSSLQAAVRAKAANTVAVRPRLITFICRTPLYEVSVSRVTRDNPAPCTHAWLYQRRI